MRIFKVPSFFLVHSAFGGLGQMHFHSLFPVVGAWAAATTMLAGRLFAKIGAIGSEDLIPFGADADRTRDTFGDASRFIR